MGLSSLETVVYIPSSYLFTFIFLGMIHTSIGLFDILANLAPFR